MYMLQTIISNKTCNQDELIFSGHKLGAHPCISQLSQNASALMIEQFKGFRVGIPIHLLNCFFRPSALLDKSPFIMPKSCFHYIVFPKFIEHLILIIKVFDLGYFCICSDVCNCLTRSPISYGHLLF